MLKVAIFFVWRSVFKGHNCIIYFCVNLLILVAHLEKQPFARGMEMGFRHVIKYFPHGFSDLVKPAGADDNRGGFTRRQSFDIIHIEFAAHI